MTTPQERMTAGYAEHDRHDADALKRRATAHRPDYDAEADRLTATIGDALPLNVRLALGYHDSARNAAHQLNHPNGDNAA